MADVTAAELVLFPILMMATIGGFWYARIQAKASPGLTFSFWKNR